MEWLGVLLVIGIAWWLFRSRKAQPQSGQAIRAPELEATITYSNSKYGERPPVPETAIQEHLANYAYVKTTTVEPVKGPAAQWFDETTHKRRVKDGSPKAAVWLAPFIQSEHLSLPSVQEAVSYGPGAAEAVQKALRAAIREARKAGVSCDSLLRSLYGAAVLVAFDRELAFCGRSVRANVALSDLDGLSLDYQSQGHQGLDSLGATDVKWLAAAFGEPAAHVPASRFLAPIVQKAVTRHCLAEAKTAGTLEGWIDTTVRLHLKYTYESPEQTKQREAGRPRASQDNIKAWAALQGEFVVADLETTGLSGSTDEILEIGALIAGKRSIKHALSR